MLVLNFGNYLALFLRLVSCFAFNLWKKTLFSLQFCFFLKLSWLKGSCCLYLMFLLLFFVSCVVCLQSKQWSCIVLCLCCLLSFFVNKTKWFLVYISWSCFFLGCLVLFHSFQKKTPKNRTQQKAQKPNMQKKRTSSQIVFLVFWGWAPKMCFCWKHYNKGVSTYFEKGKKATN